MNQVIGANYWAFSAITISAGNVTPFTGLASATLAFLTFEGSAVRFRLDGVTAHSGTGHLVSGNDALVLKGGDMLRNFNVISTVPTATIYASWGAA